MPDLQDREKRSFLQKIPGFRSGVWWKKTLAIFGYFFIFLIILASLLPGPSVQSKIESARENVVNGNLSLAISDYEDILKKWEDTEGYGPTKTEIEDELNKTKSLYATNLTEQAIAKLKSGDLEEAETKLHVAMKYDPFNPGVIEASNKIKAEKTKIDADQHLDKALELAKSGEVLKAAEELVKATDLAPEYTRVAEVRTKINDSLKTAANEKISSAKKALENWDASLARQSIGEAKALDPENANLKELDKKITDLENTIIEIGPKPVNSSWDGAVRPVTEFLDENLKDPDSVEYIEWSPVFLMNVGGQKYWAVRVKYRAKNSFGGYVIAEKIAFMQHNQVANMIDY